MNTVWKFTIAISNSFRITMPKGAKILCLQNQNETPCFWAMVNPDNALEHREFEIYGTGHEMTEDDTRIYVGSFQLNNGGFIGHVFEQPDLTTPAR